MSLSKNERKQIIEKLKKHTDVAMYAFEDALKNQSLSEDELLFLERNLEIISVLKPVIKANRNGQKKSSRKRNDKYREEAKFANNKVQELEEENFSLKQKIDNLFNELLDIKNSEIYQLGKWLKEALATRGEKRNKILKEKDLVDKEFYNSTVRKFEDESIRRDEEDKNLEEEYKKIIGDFEKRIDYLREVNRKARKFIIDNHGEDFWKKFE